MQRTEFKRSTRQTQNRDWSFSGGPGTAVFSLAAPKLDVAKAAKACAVPCLVSLP